MADYKMNPKRMQVQTKNRKSDECLKKVRMIFSDRENQFEITLDAKSFKVLHEITNDIMHREEMKHECDGYRITDP